MLSCLMHRVLCVGQRAAAERAQRKCLQEYSNGSACAKVLGQNSLAHWRLPLHKTLRLGSGCCGSQQDSLLGTHIFSLTPTLSRKTSSHSKNCTFAEKPLKPGNRWYLSAVGVKAEVRGWPGVGLGLELRLSGLAPSPC